MCIYLYKFGVELQILLKYKNIIINRTILKQIEIAVSCRPITLVTGARQVGKSTLVSPFIEKGFNYVTLDDARERENANNDPDFFLATHPWPLIIDEVQRAPNFFLQLKTLLTKKK